MFFSSDLDADYTLQTFPVTEITNLEDFMSLQDLCTFYKVSSW